MTEPNVILLKNKDIAAVGPIQKLNSNSIKPESKKMVAMGEKSSEKLSLETDKIDSALQTKKVNLIAQRKPQDLAKIAASAGEMTIKISEKKPLAPNVKPIVTQKITPKQNIIDKDFQNSNKSNETKSLQIAKDNSKQNKSISDQEVLDGKKIENLEKQQSILKLSKQLNKIQIWEGKEGAGLKRLLNQWSEQSRVTIDWKTKKKYELKMDLFISGTYENAIKTLFSMGIENPPPYVFDKNKGILTISD